MPTRIARLPDDLVNKIAAGEVVERPASVVKELVENSLDAGARTVQVEIERGGKDLIRVRDDGWGMGREDAERAIERHATSKLRAVEGLQGLTTHGFRGEALPSIASVSVLLLRTREEEGPSGTEVEVRFGELLSVREAAHPRGTSVEVRELFGAVPARRKFLRADATETSHVADALTALALGKPGTGFFLRSGGRALIEAPPVESLGARLFQLQGPEALDRSVPVEGEGPGVQVRGFASRPEGPGRGRPSIRLLVNGRAIRDRGLGRAVLDAYRSAGASSHNPEVVLLVEVPPSMVDVNVHPAKTEVRFADPRAVWTSVERAVREALSNRARAVAPAVRRQADARAERPFAGVSFVAEPAQSWLADAAGETRLSPASESQAAQLGGQGPVSDEAPVPRTLLVLGQHRRTYLVATDGEDLLLIDQHTAHERIRFEAILDRIASRPLDSQGLVAPVVFTVPPALLPVIEAQIPFLNDLGFDVEPFGGREACVRSVPALLRDRDPAERLLAILRDVAEREEASWTVGQGRERLAASLACHSAVRGGQLLQAAEMAAIARDVLATRHPTLCPHGRPTLVRIPREDISRWFERTGWKRS